MAALHVGQLSRKVILRQAQSEMIIDQQRILQQTEVFVKSRLQKAEGGHDWWHIIRVRNNARTIAQSEPCDSFIVELAALLHDIADAKFHDGDEGLGAQTTASFLQSLDLPSHIIDHVAQIVRHISFKGGQQTSAFQSAELAVVQDADRLDALGAIGIARAFSYGGYRGRALYDPDIPPSLHMDATAYRKNHGPTINHFYEKLLLLKDRMLTPTGRKMAAARHDFLQLYLDNFFREWQGSE